jgi:hypothetical protein
MFQLVQDMEYVKNYLDHLIKIAITASKTLYSN